jgi:hypothetical protein
MSRKTIEIEKFKKSMNNILKNSRGGFEEMREGVILALEDALKMADNYQGFRFLDSREVDSGKPGIRENNKFEDTDRTRRFYF